MSPSSAVVLLLVICHVDCSYEFIDANKLPCSYFLETRGLQRKVPIEEEKCTAKYSCSNCNDLLICKSTDLGYKKVMTVTCKEPTPYCDDLTNTCVSSRPKRCIRYDDFKCIQDGLFPDPFNCTKIHFCKRSIAFLYSCKNRKYFDPKSNTCSSLHCYTFNCAGKHGLKSYHRGNPNIFAYCSDSVPVTISRCGESYELNETTQKCEFVCRKEGRFVDVENDKRYYKCDCNNVLEHVECSTAHKFDPVYHWCVPSIMLERFRCDY